jgi:hypothetical protein
MKHLFQKIILWTYIKIHTIIIYVSLALYRTEEDILKSSAIDIQDKDKKTTRKLHKNPLLEKFYAGQRDERYVKDYYELLKKADKFMCKSTPHQMAVAADKHGMSYGMKDQYGRRYEHYGFFDDKHKHAGKTLGEVLTLEFEERRTKDDNYKIMYIFNNKPIEVGFAKVLDVVEKTQKENADFKYEVQDMFKKSKSFEFPIKATHINENIINKIEELTEYLHIKRIGFEYRILEFFIPLKFKTLELDDDSNAFKEIQDIKEIYVRDEYGELKAFRIIKFVKRLIHNDIYEVLKFEGIEMETIKL